jgi:hypothetical protein
MKAKNVFQYILGAMIVIGFFALMYLLLAQAVPEQNKDILNIVVGALIGSFTSIVGYFYGSSLGSADKNDLLRK